jgi:tetratricopeptide (TPR) repeat protein
VWVNEEVRQFKARNGEGRVLALIVAGEPFGSDQPGLEDRECFPKALRQRVGADGALTEERIEPAAADLRPGRDSRRRAMLRLIAGMLSVDLDELVQRDARRGRQQLLALSGVSVGVAAAMLALAIGAMTERNEAVAQRGRAEGLIEFMIGDLRRTLEPEGRLDALDAIGAQALDYYATEPLSQLDADSLGRRARVLHLLGVIRQQRGDLAAALAFFRQATASTGELMARYPNDPARIDEHAQGVAYIGEVALAQDDRKTSFAEFDAYERLAERLVALQPAKQDWWAEVEEANSNLGVVLLQEGRPEQAMAHFNRASVIAQRLVDQAPGRRDRLYDRSQIDAWMADTEAARGHVEAALADRQAESRIYAGLIAASPSDTQAIVALASCRAEIAKIDIALGRRADGIAILRQSVGEIGRLIESAPDNADYKANAASIYLLLGQALLQDGQTDGASAIDQRLLAMSQAQAAGGELAWRGQWLGGARILGIKIDAANAASLSAQRRALGPVEPEARRLARLADAHPHSLGLTDAAAEAELLAGDKASLVDGTAQARARWSAARGMLLRALGARLAPTDRAHTLLDQLSRRLASGQPPRTLRPARGMSPSEQLVSYRW